MDVGGIVLCGGGSVRMRVDKAWLTFAGRTLLQGVVEVVAQVAQPVIVVKAEGQTLPTLPPDVEIVRDRTPDRGPLEGFMSGLQRMGMSGRQPTGSRAEAVLLVACDYPFLEAGFLSHLADQLDDRLDEAEIVVPRIGDRLHPLAAVYRLGVTDRVEASLAAGRRSMHGLLDRCHCHVVEEAKLADLPGGIANLTNVNTTEEYTAAVRHKEGV